MLGRCGRADGVRRECGIRSYPTGNLHGTGWNGRLGGNHDGTNATSLLSSSSSLSLPLSLSLCVWVCVECILRYRPWWAAITIVETFLLAHNRIVCSPVFPYSCSPPTHSQVYVARPLSDNMEMEVYDNMLKVLHNPKFAEYFTPSPEAM